MSQRKLLSQGGKLALREFSTAKKSLPFTLKQGEDKAKAKPKTQSFLYKLSKEAFLASGNGFKILISPYSGFSENQVEKEAADHKYQIESRKVLAEALLKLELKSQEAIETRQAILKTNTDLDKTKVDLPHATIMPFIEQCQKVEEAAGTPDIYRVYSETHDVIGQAFRKNGSPAGYLLHSYFAKFYSTYKEVIEQPSMDDAVHVDTIRESSKSKK